MSLAKLLSDFQRRDRQLGDAIQRMERRVKILEEQNDPTSLIEPNFISDLILGGRVINTCDIKSLGSGGGGLGSGIARKDLGAGGGDATCIVKFARRVFTIDGVHIAFRIGGLPTFKADLEDTDSYVGSSMVFKVSFITEDFDIDDVTEGIDSTGERSANFSCVVTGGVMELEAGGSGNLDMSIREDGIGIPFEALQDGPYFGLKITVDGDAGGLGNAFVECDVDIDTLPADDGDNPLGLTASSTYVATIV